MSILNPVFKVFGQFLMLLYKGTNSYILAIFIFTLLLKLVLFPLNFQSKRSMMRTQTLQGKMQQLQKQYGKDKERYNLEVQKLYQDEGVSPMGGCLWSLLPLPILWGVYAIVRRPLFFMYGLTAAQVTTVQEAVAQVNSAIDLTKTSAYIEMKTASILASDSTALEAAKAALGDAADKLSTVINFNFLGVNLADTPKLKFWADGITWNSVALFLIPLIVTGVSYLSTYVSQKTNSINQDDNAAMNSQAKQMMIMMPLMYLWFGFIMPAVMCIYMALSCLFQMGQDWLCGRLLRSKFIAERDRREQEERDKKAAEKRERRERIEAKQREEAEARKKRNRAAAVAASKKDSSPKTDKGAIGIRRYALGRNYEPDRFGGVTPYKDPTDIIDEAAIEAALAAKAKRRGKQAEEPAEEPAKLPEEVTAEAAETVETAVEAVEETASDVPAPETEEK